MESNSIHGVSVINNTSAATPTPTPTPMPTAAAREADATSETSSQRDDENNAATNTLATQLQPFVDTILDITLGRFIAVQPSRRTLQEDFAEVARGDVLSVLRQIMAHNFSVLDENGESTGAQDLDREELQRLLLQSRNSENYLRSITSEMIREVTNKQLKMETLQGVVQRRDQLLKEQRHAYLRELLHLREMVRQYRTTGKSTLADAFFYAWDHDAAAEQQLQEQQQMIEDAMSEQRKEFDEELAQAEARHVKVIEDLRRGTTLLEARVQHLTMHIPTAEQEAQTELVYATCDRVCQTIVTERTAGHTLPAPPQAPIEEGMPVVCSNCGTSVHIPRGASGFFSNREYAGGGGGSATATPYDEGEHYLPGEPISATSSMSHQHHHQQHHEAAARRSAAKAQQGDDDGASSSHTGDHPQAAEQQQTQGNIHKGKSGSVKSPLTKKQQLQKGTTTAAATAKKAAAAAAKQQATQPLTSKSIKQHNLAYQDAHEPIAKRIESTIVDEVYPPAAAAAALDAKQVDTDVDEDDENNDIVKRKWRDKKAAAGDSEDAQDDEDVQRREDDNEEDGAKRGPTPDGSRSRRSSKKNTPTKGRRKSSTTPTRDRDNDNAGTARSVSPSSGKRKTSSAAATAAATSRRTSQAAKEKENKEAIEILASISPTGGERRASSSPSKETTSELRGELQNLRRHVKELRSENEAKNEEIARLQNPHRISDAAELKHRRDDGAAIRALTEELRAKDTIVQQKVSELTALKEETERWFKQYKTTQPQDQTPVNFSAIRKLSAAVAAAEDAESRYRCLSWSILAQKMRFAVVQREQEVECVAASQEANIPLLRHRQEGADKLAFCKQRKLNMLQRQREKAQTSANHHWDAVLFFARSVTHAQAPEVPPRYYAMMNEAERSVSSSAVNTVGSPTTQTIRDIVALRHLATPSQMTFAAHQQQQPQQQQHKQKQRLAEQDLAQLRVGSSSSGGGGGGRIGSGTLSAGAASRPRVQRPSTAVPSRSPRIGSTTAASGGRPMSGGVRFNPSDLKSLTPQQKRQKLIEVMRADRTATLDERKGANDAQYRTGMTASTPADDVAVGIYKWRLFGRCEKGEEGQI